MKVINQVSHVDPSKCIGCHTCERRCPAKAITINKTACGERGISPCRRTCPAGVDVSGYLGLTAQGKFLDAYNLIMKNNPFPSVCGRICSHPCEEECNRGSVDRPLSIRNIKRFLADKAYEMGEPARIAPLPANGKSIGIVGAGPSGLTCAYYLALLGYAVEVYEERPVAGGVLVFGIPEYRLPKAVLAKEIEHIEAAGVQIHLNTSVGADVAIEDLQKKHDAVYMSTGTQFSKKMGIPGEEKTGVYHGLDFLRDVNLGNELHLGRNVAVVGGGNVAIDAARTLLRLGCEKVTILYRRGILEMPAERQEVKDALTEGIHIIPMSKPVEVLGDEAVTGLRCIKTDYVIKDGFGRRDIQDVENSEFIFETDMVVPAVSQFFDLPFIGKEVFEADKKGTFVTNEETMMTSVDGIFAGGDMIRGSDVAIHAIGDGRRAAISIDKYLGGSGELYTGEEISVPDHQDASALFKHDRFPEEYLPVAERKTNFDEVIKGFSVENAINEAKRCLRCDTQTKAYVDPEKCMGCHLCVEFCPQQACSMVTLETPRKVAVNMNPEHIPQITQMCAKAHIYPLWICCTCTGTMTAEVCEAIIQGARTPEEVTRMTGAGTGCGGIYCMSIVQNLLRSNGYDFPDRGDGMYYSMPNTVWDVSDEVAERYPALHVKRDQAYMFNPAAYAPENIKNLFDPHFVLKMDREAQTEKE